VFVPFVHLVPYAIDHGIPQSSAVLLMAAIGVGSTSGRFFLGGLADRLGRALSLVVMVIGMALAFLLWAIATSFWPLAVFAFAFGLFYGGWVALMPAVVADYFGARNLGTLIGVISMCIAVGTLIGPSAAGFAFDLSHSYMVPIVASIGAYVVAAAILASASRPRGRAL
jgi:MFS family permease